MSTTLTLKEIEQQTHNVYRLVFDKPEGWDIKPGQAIEMKLDMDGWRDEGRPFTPTSLPDWDHLEFTIKSYPDHDGVTARIPKLTSGDKVMISEPWGAITDHGPGIFIGAGAGVTPFIAILRDRVRREGSLDGSTLILSNDTADDIILHDELVGMPGLSTIFTITDEKTEAYPNRRIDEEFLDEVLHGWREEFYVCGPRPFEDDIKSILYKKGVPDEKIHCDH
ncbi:ferredoxin reductase domain-containing protein [Histidinibacterium aquaticum]|uniref:Flavodoxin reductase n=1 Tax=Histidinibacterium aquaticum TaxID=2613962 RepID=A0A5J5GK73_9RHOB|nr:flavodoxin reductase [Histidinibacterium aquaticum]KAA9007954.1 flavodoxin reductase [Histidinibacterium aquaticum]